MTIIVDKSQATIEVLHEFNFKRWSEDLRFPFVMVEIEIDIAICVPKPAAITVDSTADQKLFYEKWDRQISCVCMQLGGLLLSTF